MCKGLILDSNLWENTDVSRRTLYSNKTGNDGEVNNKFQSVALPARPGSITASKFVFTGPNPGRSYRFAPAQERDARLVARPVWSELFTNQRRPPFREAALAAGLRSAVPPDKR